MRIGVNTGTVVVGGAVAGHAISVGDPMNVAARLQGQAPPGEILIGAETRALVGRQARTEPAGELELRGRREPTAAHRLIAIEGRPSADHARRAAAGRPRARVRAAHGGLRARRGAGIARVRLGARRRRGRQVAAGHRAGPSATASSATVLLGRCLSYGEGITYWALAEMIRRAAEIGEDDSQDERRAKLARAVAGADDARAGRARI